MAKNKKVLITGSGGLVGSEAVHFYARKGYEIHGIDNNMRAYFFGPDASTQDNYRNLANIYKNYKHIDADIRDKNRIEEIFKVDQFDLILHTAAQPSHDWAAREPYTDFEINANGTLNLLENYRLYNPEAVFIHVSTNKVYGDTPNKLPLVEKKTRWEIESGHPFQNGITEEMSIDDSTHSLFGASKAASDLLVQEYGRYFNLPTGVFRGGCLTGSGHAGVELHGFLSYLVRAILTGKKYTIYGYKGKQVRDNIHSSDLINAFDEFYKNPKAGEVYNMGGSRFANVSMMEAITLIEEMTGRKAITEYSETNRMGDHIWYVSSVEKFKKHYPKWKYEYDIAATIEDICKNSSFSKKFFSYQVSKKMDFWREKNWYFHNALKNIFKEFVTEDASVLQIGYGLGDVLAGLFPNKAVSFDEDKNLAELSRRRYSNFKFIVGNLNEIDLKGKFDYIIMPNSVEHFTDIQTVLEKVRTNLADEGRLIMTLTNPKWQYVYDLLEKWGLKRPEEPKNWLKMRNLENIAELAGFEVSDSGFRLLIPTHIPILSNFINYRIKGKNTIASLAVEQFIVVKKSLEKKNKNYSCTVLIPCYNEEGNIAEAIARTPNFCKNLEILIVDDGSRDKTATIVRKVMKKDKRVKLISYKPNQGKGHAVRTGFDNAKGEIIMILDADMTVPPEELGRFYNVLASGQALFANGTRLIYPMEDQAMRSFNLLGNVGFSYAFSYILGQRVTDTLCGTKALFKKDYKKIKMTGEGWGDFDLLFGASENNLKIKEVPVHYKKRVAGESKMKGLKHGFVMLKMVGKGFVRLKLKPLLS